MTSASHNSRSFGMLAAVAAVSIWAAWIPMTRLGVTTSLGPLDLAALRFFTAGLVMLPLVPRIWRDIPWHRPWVLAWLIGGAGVPYILAFGYGLKLANSGQGAVLGPGANSVFVGIMAAVFLREHIPPRRLASIALVLVGIAVILGHDMSRGGVHLESFALVLLASILWSAHTVASRALHLEAVATTALVSVANGLLLLPIVGWNGGFARIAAAPIKDVAIQAIFQGVIVAIIALIAYNFAIRRLGASATAMFPPLTPVLAAIIGFFMLGDSPDGATILGLGLVLAGVGFSTRQSSASLAK